MPEKIQLIWYSGNRVVIKVPIRTKNCKGVLKISDILAVMQSWVSHFVKATLVSGNLERQLSKAELGLFLAGLFLLHWLSVAPVALFAPWASENVQALSPQFHNES